MVQEYTMIAKICNHILVTFVHLIHLAKHFQIMLALQEILKLQESEFGGVLIQACLPA